MKALNDSPEMEHVTYLPVDFILCPLRKDVLLAQETKKVFANKLS